MKTAIIIGCGVFTALTLSIQMHAQQVEWRFGFEDTYSMLGGLLTTEQKHQLLDKIELLTASQQAAGDININGNAGGWISMQPLANGPINFTVSDEQIRVLQDHGFSMLWNLRINAIWASENNDGCYDNNIVSDCAPDAEHEDHLYNYIRAIVERYDGDGIEDMGFETPDDPSDDLRIPVQFYLMTGEIEFAGATPPSEPGYGDEARNHFWTDNIPNLLRTHRIVYRALRDADPTGFSKLVSSGGVLWDLYTDFPDWPEIEGPTVTARLNGDNNHDAIYVESFERLKTMLSSFGDDSDGIECDYIGWHPHMPWREIDQAFAFIKTYAGDKPIYVDDMWANIFIQDRADAPGNTQFFPGGAAMEGDFPNELVDSYQALRRGVNFNLIPGARDWYLGRHSRHLVKSFVSAFGEGAERVCISGIADIALDRLGLGSYINLTGTLAEDFAVKPGYFTYKLMVDKLHDFSQVEEIPISADPRTRAYRFERPERGPIYVMWSETGNAPANLDYSIPNGESVTLAVESDTLLLTHVISLPGQTEPDVEMLQGENRQLTIDLGYSPYFIEPVTPTSIEDDRTALYTNEDIWLRSFPNPTVSSSSVIEYRIPDPGRVRLTVYSLLGRQITTLVDDIRPAGRYNVPWNSRSLAGTTLEAGMYVCRLQYADVVRNVFIAVQ